MVRRLDKIGLSIKKNIGSDGIRKIAEAHGKDLAHAYLVIRKRRVDPILLNKLMTAALEAIREKESLVKTLNKITNENNKGTMPSNS